MTARPVQPTILVTGAAGGLASIVVDLLAEQYRLVGVDPRPMPHGRNFPGTFIQVDYNHRRMTEVFRRHKFKALLHLGRITATSGASTSYRYNMNVLGTRNLMAQARKYGVRDVIVFSTFHVYGAHKHNHLYIEEDEPLRASQIFPELSDAIELDNYVRTFSLRYPDLRVVVLRPANVIGSRIRNDISMLLRSEYCPMLLGYDPFMQFVSERDVARALSAALHGEKSGVYNLAGEGLCTYSKAIELAGSIGVPVPHFLAYPALGVMKYFGGRIPKHLIDYFRYPCVISDETFRKDFGYRPEVSTVEALLSLRS